MQIETYEVTETLANGQTENASDPEALALIESLGLDGQKQLLGLRQAGDDVAIVRSPYRLMTREEERVFEAVCPQTTKLREYAGGAIPLRVLQVAAHAQEFFDWLEVWHPDGATLKDPVLVGVKEIKDPRRSWMTERQRFILARWGEVLDDFETVRAQARERVLVIVQEKVAAARAELEAFEARIATAVDSHLRGARIDTPTVSIGFTA